MHVPNFKADAMYERANDLLFEVYNEVANINEAIANKLRWRAVRITMKITRAIIEHNRKMKMKLLNEAKEHLVELLEESYKLHDYGQIDGYLIDEYGEQLLKLIHYQFGKLKMCNIEEQNTP